MAKSISLAGPRSLSEVPLGQIVVFPLVAGMVEASESCSVLAGVGVESKCPLSVSEPYSTLAWVFPFPCFCRGVRGYYIAMHGA